MSNRRNGRMILLGAAVLAAALVAPAGARAQSLEEPRGRQGYYLGLGLHQGMTGTWEKGDALGAWRGGQMQFRFGEMITSRFGLGLLIASGGAGQGGDNGQTAGLGGLSLEGTATLVGNLALTASAGLGFLSLTDPTDEDEGQRGTAGAMYGVGLSWDWFPFDRRTGGFAVTPNLRALFLPGGDVNMTAVFLGVDLLWWTGLPKNQLKLPDNEAYKK